MGKVAYIQEVVVSTSLLDEALFALDTMSSMRGQAGWKDLSDDLCNGMNQVNRSILRDLAGPLFLGQKNNVGRIKPLKMGNREGY
jgi:hypothetical protein